MSENAQSPVTQNPDNAETFCDYESTWKGFNQIQIIVNCLLLRTYEQDIQDSLEGIQDPYCLDTLSMDYIRKLGQLSPSDAVKLITPLAEQLKASPNVTAFGTGDAILDCCKKIESLLGA